LKERPLPGCTAVTDPITLRIVRPYASVEAYLAAEANTIDRRGMLLVGAQPLPEGTLVRFAIQLANGESVIKAEGKVREHVRGDSPTASGLRVLFRRFAATTKTLIDRAIELREAHGHGPASTDRLSDPELSPFGHAEPAVVDVLPSAPMHPAPAAPLEEPAPHSERASHTELPRHADPARHTDAAPEAVSGVRITEHAQPAGHAPAADAAVVAPPTRDRLLDRLRTRAEGLGAARVAELSRRAG
jgi:hypothetical protein